MLPNTVRWIGEFLVEIKPARGDARQHGDHGKRGPACENELMWFDAAIHHGRNRIEPCRRAKTLGIAW